ncbi:glucose 1,6-bisphosphate synthase [Eupeodes corollae]|uniref:glucose 1,6-bisphosphate synthase n=1 Tax=Eupeodes corollae TaxID=290404 RepID=UPI002491D47B|nr:glucose 1,6-bisphosphate synthase [Eupeodes corollae]
MSGVVDECLQKQIDLWLKWDRNDKTRKEIQSLVDAKNYNELNRRLLNRLAFGTAGLRGPMRAGFNSMNDLVIIQTAQGLSEYILKEFPNVEDHKRGVVFGYDGRYNSKRFAELSACVLISRGIKVWLFSKMVPTPFVPFTVLQHKCLAGVVVTASHNPKEDNGYKVYWANGPQIIPPHDKGIQKCIEANLVPLESSWETSILNENPMLEDPFEDMFRLYYDALLANIPLEFLKSNEESDVRFVYTAMHGVGFPFIERAFEAAKLKPVLAVAEQRDPDPEFPTVKFPNPEEGKSSLELSIKKADAEGATIILANDPDADRLACAEKDATTGKWKVFNGNELGALIGWWALKNFQTLDPNLDASKCYMMASTVSSKILRSMGAIEGYKFEETLTGFKWMGNRTIELMEAGNKVLFAFEEAIGFMVSTAVLDKDGVSAAAHLATMVCYLKRTEGITLTEKLKNIYEKYGFHSTKCSYLFCYDPPTIKRIFARIRSFDNGKPATYPQSILDGEFKIKHIRDLTNGVDTSEADGKAKLPVSSSSEMITFTFENGLVVTLRTSGTEPKIKYYAEMCAKPEEKDWAELGRRLDRMVEAIVEEFLQPKLNDLTPKSD